MTSQENDRGVLWRQGKSFRYANNQRKKSGKMSKESRLFCHMHRMYSGIYNEEHRKAI